MGSAGWLAGVLLAVWAATVPGAAQAQAGGVAQAKTYGPGFAVPGPGGNTDVSPSGGGVTEYDLSLGCIVGGTAGTALSMSAGGMNVVNLIAGGLVPATSPVAMWVALGGVVFASFCSVGQALTPTVMATYAYFVPPEPVFGGPTMDARFCQVAATLSPATPPLAGQPLPARYIRRLAERPVAERM